MSSMSLFRWLSMSYSMSSITRSSSSILWFTLSGVSYLFMCLWYPFFTHMSIQLLFYNSIINFGIRRRGICFLCLACLWGCGADLFFGFFVFGGCGPFFLMLGFILLDKETSHCGESF